MNLPVGVLALQGDFANHMALLGQLGHASKEVRVAEDLSGLSGLVIPGGESTTIWKGIERERLREPLEAFRESGLPIFGTCAGLVLLGRGHLSWINAEVERNGYGTQINSFEADVPFAGLGHPPVRAVFIRAPIIRSVGPEVEVLAEVDGLAVAARQENVMAISFHPELVNEQRIHQLALTARAQAAQIVD